MKKFLVAITTTLSLAVPVFAQGLPPGLNPPMYGSHAFPDKQYENGTIFSKLFGHSKDTPTIPDDESAKTTKPSAKDGS